MSNKKRLILIIGILLVFGLLIFYVFPSKENEVEETPISNSTIENGYGLDVDNVNSTEETEKKGLLILSNLKDVINVKINNVGRDREFVLKVFYDYNEIPFKVEGEEEFKNEHFFNLSDNYQADLPIHLPSSIKPDQKAHKLLFFLYPGPNIHEKDIKARTAHSNMVLNYDVLFNLNQNNPQFNEDNEYEKPLEQFDVQYQGIVINQDLKNEGKDLSLVKYPPYNLKVKKDEDLTLAYTLGGYADTTKFLMVLTIDWKQWNIDNKPYKLLNIKESKLGHGTFTIKTPTKPGLYEVTAYLVKDPFKLNNEDSFVPIDNSFRFTLEIE